MSEKHQSEINQDKMLAEKKEHARKGRQKSNDSLLNNLMLNMYSSLFMHSPIQNYPGSVAALNDIPHMIKVMKDSIAEIRKDPNNKDVDLDDLIQVLIRHHESIRATQRNRHLLYELTQTEFTRMLNVAKMKVEEPLNLDEISNKTGEIIYALLIKSDDIHPKITYNDKNQITKSEVNDDKIIEKISYYMFEHKKANPNSKADDDQRLLDSLIEAHSNQIKTRNTKIDPAEKETHTQTFPLSIISKHKFKQILYSAMTECNKLYDKHLENEKKSNSKFDNPFI